MVVGTLLFPTDTAMQGSLAGFTSPVYDWRGSPRSSMFYQNDISFREISPHYCDICSNYFTPAQTPHYGYSYGRRQYISLLEHIDVTGIPFSRFLLFYKNYSWYAMSKSQSNIKLPARHG